MKFTAPESDEPEITVIPLIDVILVLLIFFMATATFDQNSRIKVQLPESSSEAAADTAQPLIVQMPKLVRDSFTIPKDEYAGIDTLKERSVALGRPAKKSELLRAGLMALLALSPNALHAALEAVPTIKTGRPKSDK